MLPRCPCPGWSHHTPIATARPSGTGGYHAGYEHARTGESGNPPAHPGRAHLSHGLELSASGARADGGTARHVDRSDALSEHGSLEGAQEGAVTRRGSVACGRCRCCGREEHPPAPPWKTIERFSTSVHKASTLAYGDKTSPTTFLQNLTYTTGGRPGRDFPRQRSRQP